jgi:hypothetical protein
MNTKTYSDSEIEKGASSKLVRGAPLVFEDIAILRLTKGRIAVIDKADVPLVSSCTWYLATAGKKLYAAATINGRGVKLHRLLLGIVGAPDIQGDHIDGDGLNNRRSNIRTATPAQNALNKTQAIGRSGYTGVRSRPYGKGYYAIIERDRREKYLGTFYSKHVAALAYNIAAYSHDKDFSRLNKIDLDT